MNANELSYTVIDSPVGPLTVGCDAEGRLGRLSFGVIEDAVDDGAHPEVRRQLAEYFSGARDSFDLVVSPTRGTEFERSVWDELQRIPYGETRSYGEVAVAVCGPDRGHGAARAVGGANNRNPIAIVVPCHRVVGANGKLVGFAGGLDTKRRLLDLEAGRTALI